MEPGELQSTKKKRLLTSRAPKFSTGYNGDELPVELTEKSLKKARLTVGL